MHRVEPADIITDPRAVQRFPLRNVGGQISRLDLSEGDTLIQTKQTLRIEPILERILGS